MDKPLARSSRIIVEESGAELLVYDEDANIAHCLGADVSAVWACCDGQTTAASIATATGLAEAAVDNALDEVERCNLLSDLAPQTGRYNRRVAGLKLAKVGAAAAAAPLIMSIAIPPATAQASTCANAGQGCFGADKTQADGVCQGVGCSSCNGVPGTFGGYSGTCV